MGEYASPPAHPKILKGVFWAPGGGGPRYATLGHLVLVLYLLKSSSDADPRERGADPRPRGGSSALILGDPR